MKTEFRLSGFAYAETSLYSSAVCFKMRKYFFYVDFAAKTELQNSNEKMKELRQEVHQEKQRYNMLEKQTREKMESQLGEVQALHTRMQHSHEQHTAEVGALWVMYKYKDEGWLACMHSFAIAA